MNLDVLIAQAEERCKGTAAAANASVPPYSSFLEAAARIGECVGAAGVSARELSRAVYLLTMVAACPGRERL